MSRRQMVAAAVAGILALALAVLADHCGWGLWGAIGFAVLGCYDGYLGWSILWPIAREAFEESVLAEGQPFGRFEAST